MANVKDKVYVMRENRITEAVVFEVTTNFNGTRYLLRTPEDKFYADEVFTTIDDLITDLRGNVAALTASEYNNLITYSTAC